MKKQIELIFPAVFAVALFALPCAQAASANAGATNAPASAVTNAKPTNAMAALFGDPAVARGKGFEIKRSELDEVMTGLKSAAVAHGQVIPQARLVQIEGQMLNRLIQVQLLLQKATAADKAEGAQKAGLQMAALLERAGSQEALDRQMKALGMTPDELHSKVTQETTAQAVLTRELNITATDAEATNFYTDHPAEFEQPEMVTIRHIFLMTVDQVTQAPLTMEQQQNKHKLAEEILKRARAGEDFVALVKQYSEDPTKNSTNEIVLARGNPGTPPEVEAAAFSLTNNQISDVVTTTYGYAIIKLISKTPAKKLALTDKVPMSDVIIADRVKEGLKQQKIEKLAPVYLDKLQKDADVQILDADLKAAVAAAAEAAAATANAPGNAPEK
jgi:parvulin-like peptidyl-prolyl isomerase